MNDREILLRLITSLTRCDHMGDVCGDVEQALKLAGIEIGEWNDMAELRDRLREMKYSGLWDE